MTHPDRPLPGQHYHLVGVAGVGMSALAEALLYRGARVSGSDRYLDRGEELGILARLKRAGVHLHPQDGSGLDTAPDAIVCSTAIEDDNPDLLAARAAGVAVRHRAEGAGRSLCRAAVCGGERHRGEDHGDRDGGVDL